MAKTEPPTSAGKPLANVLQDPSFNIHTTLHNTSLEALLAAQPDLLS